MALDPTLIDLPAGRIAAVVTTLEMRQAPPTRTSSGVGLALEQQTTMTPDAYRDLFRRVGQDWLWFSRLMLPDDALTAILHDPGVEVWTLMAAGRAEGLLELDFRTPGACELAFLGLTAGHVGTGAGRGLMNHAIARAWAKPIARFWVHTCTLDHPAALGFYERSGFVAVGRQMEIADDPRLTGVLPRAAAPQVPIIDEIMRDGDRD